MWLTRALIATSILGTTLLMIGCGGAVGATTNSTNSGVALNLVAVTPTSAPVSSSVMLQATGSGFNANSIILFNGASTSTTQVDPSNLTAQLSASALAQPGDVDIAIQDRQTLQQSNRIRFHIVPLPSITTTTLSTATSGTAYSATLAATGGQSPYKWSLASGTLPTGMSLSTAGVLAGTPSQSGTFSFAVSATDSETTPLVATQSFSLVVQAPLSITTTSLANATSGMTYSTTLAATGGQSPYKWSLTSGTLPTGITLSNAGVLAGTPAQSGTFNFTVSAADSEATPLTASESLSLVVQAPLSITTTNLPSGQVNTAYNAAVAASGGAAPYSWSIYSGALPTGVSLVSSTGVISGTPSVSGPFNVTLAVQDAQGTSTRASFSITIAAVVALQITTASLPNGIEGLPYDATVSATGGTPPYTWSLISGSLPSSIALAATTGEIDGTPTTSGTFTPTLQVTDSASNAVSKPLPLTVTISSGPVMRSGSGAPSNSVGSDGDLYHRTDVPSLYGPKSGGVWPATYSMILGKGCTTAYHIDADCDGYGVGTDSNDPNPLFGPDADDTDATVNTTASVLAKYGTIASFLITVKGYSPNHTWYISPTGNDSTCVANDITKPCAFWSSSIATGDVVLVRAGTTNLPSTAAYGLSSIPSGTSGHPTIIMSYPGEAGHLNLTSSTPEAIVTFGGQSYITLDNLILSSTTSGAGNGGGITAISASPTTYINILNCEEYNSYDGIWVGGGANTNWTIKGNVIRVNLGEHNIYLGTNSGNTQTSLIVSGNIMYNAGRDNFHYNGICNGCTLDSNIMYSANMTPGGGSGNISLQQGWKNGFVTNNVIFNSSATSFLINDYDDGNGCPPICPYNQNYNVIANNTFIHTGRDASGQDLSLSGFAPVGVINGSTTAGLDLGHNTYANNVFIEGASGSSNGAVVVYVKNQAGDSNWLATDTWTNNIIYASNSAPPLRTSNTNTPPYTAQTWAYFGSTAAAFTNNLQSNPLLTAWNPVWYNAPQNFNLMLQSSSPAIGAGTHTGAPSTDIQGTTRANPPSIGAYE